MVIQAIVGAITSLVLSGTINQVRARKAQRPPTFRWTTMPWRRLRP